MSIDSHQPPITPDAPRHNAPASPQPPFRPGPLGRLARLAFRYRGRTVLVWMAAFVVALGLSTAFAGAFNADYSAPGSDSAAAQDLLTTRFPASANDTVTLVAHSTQPVTAPDVRARIDQTLRGRADPHREGRQPRRAHRGSQGRVHHQRRSTTDRVRGRRAARRRRHPAADVRLHRGRRAAHPGSPRRPGRQLHAHRADRRTATGPGLVDLAGHHDRHRRRHRLRAADGHPVPNGAPPVSTRRTRRLRPWTRRDVPSCSPAARW